MPDLSAAKAVVVGASGHAKVVIASLRAAGWVVLAAYDDDPSKHGSEVLGVSVAGPARDALLRQGVAAVVAIGDNLARRQVVDQLRGLSFVSVLHPAAVVDGSARVKAGSVVFAGAVVQADSIVGRHSIVNTGASVDHDCVLGDFAHLAPGTRLAGGVRVGEGALLGLGAVVLPGVSIGAWATVGAGAAVLDDVPAGATVVGVPARPLARRG